MALILAASPVRAADSVPVLELFTSQGCSSCPSADKLFESYARRTDVVALSLAVDYWDYLGWKDTLASPKYSSRQRDYAAGRGDGQVYTPQLVINGQEHVVGSDRQSIERAIARSAATPRAATITMTLAADGKSVEVVSQATTEPLTQPATVWIVAVAPTTKVKVERGENRGRELTYYNVVRDLVAAGKLEGRRASLPIERAKLPFGDGTHLAALVQAGKGGPIIAAAWLD